MPIDLNPVDENLYFTNQSARDEAGTVVLNPGSGDLGEILRVVPVQFPLSVPDNIAAVLVKTIAGKTVICRPRCFPKKCLDIFSPSSVTCEGVEERCPYVEGDEVVCSDTLYFDFSLLPEDKYTIEFVTSSRPVDEISWECLYTASYPVPLCFIDLLFRNPTGDDTGVYPVREVGGVLEVVPTYYELRFEPRSTYWSYYIVPQSGDEAFDDLKINSTGRVTKHFSGPCCVNLPTGQSAFLFVSDEPITLQQRYNYPNDRRPELRFTLSGRHRHTGQKRVLDGWLPMASNEQVLPMDFCSTLEDKLYTNAAADGRCDKLLRRLGCGEGGEVREYSEIYVYV